MNRFHFVAAPAAVYSPLELWHNIFTTCKPGRVCLPFLFNQDS